jgi:hypothetical protein
LGQLDGIFRIEQREQAVGRGGGALLQARGGVPQGLLP